MSAEVPRSSSFTAWLRAALLASNLTWTTLCLGGFPAETMVVTSVLTWSALALLLARSAWERGEGAAGLHPAGWFFFPFLIFGLVNVLWITPVRWLGWRDWLAWAQMISVFWIALDVGRERGPRRLLLTTGILLGVVTLMLACYQRFFNPAWLMLGREQVPQFVGRASGTFGIPNSLAAFLLLLIPPVLAGMRVADTRARKIAWAALGGLFLFGLFLTVSRGAWISLGLALSIWPLLISERSWVWRTQRSGLIVATVIALGGALYVASPRVRERFDFLIRESGERTRPIMWRAAWKLWREAPVFGTGAGSYNVLFERHRPEGYRDEPRWAHNDYLNTLSEYGVVGFGLFFGAGVLAGYRILRSGETSTSVELRTGLVVGLLAFALSLLIDFHLKLPALAMLAACVVAELVRCAWPTHVGLKSQRRFWRIALGVASTGVGVGLVAWIVPLYRAEALRETARTSVDALALRPVEVQVEHQILEAAHGRLLDACRLDSANAQAWADASYVTSLLARHEPAHLLSSAREAESEARRAVALTTVVPEFWWRQGVALDMQGRWIEGGAAFAKAGELAPKSGLGWYYQAYHLSLRPEMRAKALEAVATCLRLDPGSRVAELLREQLASPR